MKNPIRSLGSRLRGRIAVVLGVAVHHRYHVIYDNPLTQEHWEDDIENLVPDVKLNEILSVIYGTTAKPGTMYVGLVTGPGSGNTYAAADTMSSHAGWTEATPYSDTTRRTASFAATATSKSISNSSSPAVFNINATATVAGCFMADNSTKSGTTGTLAGVGSFSSGDKSVSSGGTLTVTVTATAS